MGRFDILWKGIFEDLFLNFLQFFYPNADELFDLSRGFEFMDKELSELFTDVDKSKVLHVDKLVKVWLRMDEEH